MTTTPSPFGTSERDVIAQGPWPAVARIKRGPLRRLGRGVAYVLLPGRLRRAIVRSPQTGWLTVTRADELVVAGFTAEPLRLKLADYSLLDSGDRQRMPTVVRGKLAGVTLATQGQGSFDLLVAVDALDALGRL